MGGDNMTNEIRKELTDIEEVQHWFQRKIEEAQKQCNFEKFYAYTDGLRKFNEYINGIDWIDS